MLRRGGEVDLFSFLDRSLLPDPLTFGEGDSTNYVCKCIWWCVKKGEKGRGLAFSRRLLCSKCEVINYGQPVHIASFGQHVVVARAMWYRTKQFPPQQFINSFVNTKHVFPTKLYSISTTSHSCHSA